MQRRAAAIYFVFFLVIGAGAWAFIGYAEDTQRPQFSVSGPTFENGTTHAIGGTEYTATEVVLAGGGGGGHGGGGGGEPEATFVWTNESALHTATLENDTVVDYQDDRYSVYIANNTNVTTATLEEYFNVSAMLRADDAVENTLATQNGTEYVVYRDDQRLEPLDEYLPDPDVVEFAVGDTMAYGGNETTVREIEPAAMTVGWHAPGEAEFEVQEGTNVTLAGGEQYFAHFPTDHSVTLVDGDQYPQYSETLDARDYFSERIAGLWGIVIVAVLAAILLLSAAYMPVRG